MQLLQRRSAVSQSDASFLDDSAFYSLYTHGVRLQCVLYRVVPAGKNFFHILEVPSGRIKGFRSGHNQACALAKELEALMCASRG